MRPVAVEVVHILAEDAPQMGLAQDQEVVQAFPPDAPEEALAGGVLPGRTIGRAQLLDAGRRGGAGEGGPVLTAVRRMVEPVRRLAAATCS